MANNYWKERSVPYKPGQTAPFKVSRSKIELFMQCPRCFWLDVRLKITRPNTPPFNINKTIDELFKKADKEVVLKAITEAGAQQNISPEKMAEILHQGYIAEGKINPSKCTVPSV
jgi:hypothetical protein